MSRVGNAPVSIPDGVNITINPDTITVKGPKGELNLKNNTRVKVTQEDNTVKVARANNTKLSRSLHGTYQRHISNMVAGVTNGFSKDLELVGVGYRVNQQGKKIVLSLGFSHPIEYSAPEGIDIKVEGNNKITISGINKQAVGQAAATIRGFRPPEPYKGKGVRYAGEVPAS